MNDTNIGLLPKALTDIDEYAFYNTAISNEDLIFPSTMKNIYQCAFMQSNRTVHNSLDLSAITMKSLQSYIFYNNVFNSDFVCPQSVTSISTYFNYNGCFRNIYFHEGVTSLSSYCFGSSAGLAQSDFFTQSVVFAGVTPPTTIGSSLFATQNVKNGLKIYVPDNSVEAYKAIANFSSYVDIILPMSQRP